MIKRIVLLASLLAACGGNDPVAPEERYGVYALETRKGHTVPAGADIPINGGLDTITNIASGLLELRRGDTHATSLSVHVDLQTFTEPFALGAGRASYAGNGVSLTLSEGRTVHATFSGPVARPLLTVEMGEPFGTMVFRRFLDAP